MAGQPTDGAHVQVVGGLVHEQDVPVAHEHAGQVHAATLAAGEVTNAPLPVQVADQLVHDPAGAGVARPDVLGHVAHHGMTHGLVVAEGVALGEHAHVDPVAPDHTAVVGLHGLGDNLEQGGFAVAVAADDADAVALVDADGLVREDRLAGPLVPNVLQADQDRHAGSPAGESGFAD